MRFPLGFSPVQVHWGSLWMAFKLWEHIWQESSSPSAVPWVSLEAGTWFAYKYQNQENCTVHFHGCSEDQIFSTSLPNWSAKATELAGGRQAKCMELWLLCRTESSALEDCSYEGTWFYVSSSETSPKAGRVGGKHSVRHCWKTCWLWW